MTKLTDNIADFQQALADWYATAQRPLPWRTAPSLYKTVVSELMAQQTQIKTMLPYFDRWLKRFPDFQALADAPSDDVLKHWEGLGYYSRARNLHKLAQEYVALDPKPTTAKEWQALPGIGPYTSAAISSIAQNFPAAVVDGNVVRILARLTNDDRAFKNNGDAVKSFTPTADTVLNHSTPGDHNQAMMELGATICQKANPLCTVCPVVQFCAAAAAGTQEGIPNIQRKAIQQVQIDRVWIVQDKKLLLHRIPDNAKQLAGQYELPATTHFEAKPKLGKALATKTRGITNKRIKETIYPLKSQTSSLPPQVSGLKSPPSQLSALPPQVSSLSWVALDQLDSITLSGPHRRWTKELLKQRL
ncbi:MULTISPECIES: A/G-specific adenine glycosylase [unclassified Lentimonas]|uniref:A/G-specific adenine glycosylase n=1 Tax=unclassified Lentimonas TaxID=2630993 RepID=UPI001324FD9E|nr:MULTISPECIES: A/G-specific adenine glycosylase [unclassified Lentimonas]CAA6680088.1 A/G-specific adenine glycosylase (EC [Lentimonas sp. CC4]CAA6685068.1 A/G-specific adenine glycosylase (EC [Lentimonas sp. CC6]CAA7074092.1 A/G-specific adenine glycosylase (EC [Lentimonas sp. CC4]CAA7171721.1 A/G-specific adenine glycosylase (EC [Lentimonas sp. CC21]CAA7181925.1 A/G-specific adenine glycosylase (EC [Lentimonas sp. CC8]